MIHYLLWYILKKIMITIWYNHDYSAFRISITIMITITGHIFFMITIIIMITRFQKILLRLWIWLQCNQLKIVNDDNYDHNRPQPCCRLLIIHVTSSIADSDVQRKGGSRSVHNVLCETVNHSVRAKLFVMLPKTQQGGCQVVPKCQLILKVLLVVGN